MTPTTSHHLQQDKQALGRRVERFIEDRGSDSFERLALDLFRFQYSALPALQRYWDSFGAGPETTSDWTSIPPVGLSVFKRYELFCGSEIVERFTTSGTSGRGRGTSLFDGQDLQLMHRAILVNASTSLFRDGQHTRFLMLVPSPQEAPQMIMAHGMARIASRFGIGDPFFAVGSGRLLDDQALQALKVWTDQGSPITMIGGSFGFVNFMERMPDNCRLTLPPGSRLLDAGGFKGRSREVDRFEFMDMVEDRFGIPRGNIFNLYGLTELASQFYSLGEGSKQPPHWTRVRVVDPMSLKDVKPHQQGVPLLIDLANVSRPMAVITDDIAEAAPDGGFHLLGRASGSAPRGCSLDLETLR